MSDRLGEETNEQELLDGLRRSDPASQERLVRLYGPRVMATARRYLRNQPDDAADVFQDAFIRIFKGIGSFEGRSTLWYWMRCITVRVALNQIQKNRRRAETSLEVLPPNVSIEIESTDPSTRPAETLVENADRDRHVRDAVAALPDQYRNVIVLRDLVGANTKEASEALGVNTNVARIRLHRGRAALRGVLEKNFAHSDLLRGCP